MFPHIRNRYFLLMDIAMMPVIIYAGFVLRLDDLTVGIYWHACLALSGLAALCIPVVYMLFGIYRRYWPYAALEDILQLAGALVCAVMLFGFLDYVGTKLGVLPASPRSIPLIFGLLLPLATLTPRLVARVLNFFKQVHPHDGTMAQVLIMGAGEAGSLIVQELRRNAHVGMQVVGFVDDDPRKKGVYIRGLPVLGNRNDIPRLVLQYDVSQVIIALPTAPGNTIREVVTLCEDAGVKTQIIPGVFELLNGRVSINKLRKVEIEDLLRREPVKTDIDAVKALLRGQRVLITGGGGSIGSELCRQVLQCGPSELIVLGHGENSVFEIENELSQYVHPAATGSCKITTVIADLRMSERLQAIFARHHPQVVFHAAAHKHVPLMEHNPTEAITNNVIGTRNVLNACLRHNVDRFVLISTDKAVNPTSIMGASKRIAELLVLQTARASGKAYAAVRFGNVLGSRGSVVLTFRRQIAAGGPVTVTDPEMRRYFMTIPEAVQLVLQAAVLGRGGEVFMLEMGQPVKLVDLACDMIRLSGLELGRDIDIKYTGIRPGEKLFEELFIKGEEYRGTAHAKIFVASNASNCMPEQLNELVNDLEAAAQCNDTAAVTALLRRLVKEYQPATAAPNLPEPAIDNTSEASPSYTKPARPLLSGSE